MLQCLTVLGRTGCDRDRWTKRRLCKQASNISLLCSLFSLLVIEDESRIGKSCERNLTDSWSSLSFYCSSLSHFLGDCCVSCLKFLPNPTPRLHPGSMSHSLVVHSIRGKRETGEIRFVSHIRVSLLSFRAACSFRLLSTLFSCCFLLPTSYREPQFSILQPLLLLLLFPLPRVVLSHWRGIAVCSILAFASSSLILCDPSFVYSISCLMIRCTLPRSSLLSVFFFAALCSAPRFIPFPSSHSLRLRLQRVHSVCFFSTH